MNTYFSLRAKCWLRGGVGGQFARNVYLSIMFLLLYGSPKFYDNRSQFWGMSRMGGRLECPVYSPHIWLQRRRTTLPIAGVTCLVLADRINMQLLCNYVELQAISPALAIVFENMTPTNKAFVSVRLYFDCTQSAVKVLFQQHWLL